MKSILTNIKKLLLHGVYFVVCLFIISNAALAQDDSASTPEAPIKVKPVKNTFQSVWIIDNQTVMVPVKGTFEMDIMHRFGTVNKGYKDLWGFFAPSNIRLGVNYAPIKNLFVGIGITKSDMLWDANAKYAIIQQTKGKYPVSISYYGNVAIDTRKDPDNSLFKSYTEISSGFPFNFSSQRLTYFNQLIIARKINSKLSVQIAPSLSHQNFVTGYYTKNDSTGQVIFKDMKHAHFAVAFSARYKLTTVTSVMVNYDQPLTRHNTNNPNPNVSFGLEFNTSSHSFQLFCTNYYLLSPQRNNLYNTNSPFGYTDKTTNSKVKGGQFMIGFNITRLWNY
jgi:Membrane bound beta barrel domain (DUF5777)